jgi:hypothetical protein
LSAPGALRIVPGVRLLPIAVLGLLTFAACTKRDAPASPQPPSAAQATKEARAPSYSPFVLQMSTELPFGRISFKDVGMSVAPEHRRFVYEEMAQSLALELASDEALPMSSEVQYSEAAADPAAHLACGVDQISVDVWSPEGTERWGYSLWSGCSEDDRFALEEVKRESEDDVDALARGIAGALRRAVEAGCFIRHC